MYVYGGYIPEKAVYMNDIYTFDFETRKWEVHHKYSNKDDEP